MSDKNVYEWNPYGTNEGLPLGSQVAENNIVEDIFSLGLPIDKCSTQGRMKERGKKKSRKVWCIMT